MNRVRIIWVISDIGHNHYARMTAIAMRTDTELHVIEIFNQSGFDEFNYSGKIDSGIFLTRLELSRDVSGTHQSKISDVLYDIFFQFKPDIVCVPGWGEWYAVAALAAANRIRIPAIMLSDSAADDAPRVGWKEFVKRRVVGLCSAGLVAGTRHVQYITELGMPLDVVFTGYDIVDNAYFSTQSDVARLQKYPFDLPDNFFLTSNRFIEKKNLPRLIEAYAAYVAVVGADAWCLVMLGDGPLRSLLVEQVARLQLSGKVIFTGFKDYDSLPIYYGLARAFIHSSTSEQWGLVVNEAMAAGLPVLVSDRCGCAPDLVKNGVNGFTFDPYDITDIVTRMLQIGGAECDLSAMGNASREIIGRWSPETFALSMMKAAAAALASAPPRAGCCDRALLWLLRRR